MTAPKPPLRVPLPARLPTPKASATMLHKRRGAPAMAEGGGVETASGNAPAVFVSYASRDTAVADTVVQALERQGLNCWVAPRDVTPGASYAGQIIHAIDGARASVLILSKEAAASPHVLREVERAASKRHPIIALRIDEAPLPADFEYFLNASHWLDTSTADIERALPKLVAAVQLALQDRTQAPASTTTSHASPPAASAKSPKKLPLILTSVIGLGLVGFAMDRLWVSRQNTAAPAALNQSPSAPASTEATPAIPEKSVAVLPFVDMSEKKNQEYFADGMSEELIDHLAHTPDLKVIARTSSFQFKGHNEDMRTIGKRLGVANLLEGSVRTSGKTVRVTAQLIKASDGSHLWSESYDRDVRDIFKVQDAIAAAVVTALQVRLATSSVRERPVQSDAYKAVLRGRYFRGIKTKEDSERAIAAFREAIRLDPAYAIAFAELAITYDDRAFRSWMPSKEAYARARAAIDASLKIAPTLAIAHRARGWIERDFNFDFDEWRVEKQRADELDPEDPSVMGDAFMYAFVSGHLDESIRVCRRLVERNPLDSEVWEFLWLALLRANQLTEAEAAARTVLELTPHAAFAHAGLAFVLLYERKPDAALAVARQESDEASRRQVLSDILWALGRRTEADALLAEIKNNGDTQAFVLAERYAVRNDKDEAFRWLGRAYENRIPEVIWIRTDETLQNLHDDPRWVAFLRKMNLPE